jgi:O-antigen/teichoic acid export membrane protein
LRKLAVRGGAYLVGREALGVFIRLAGVLITLRVIGPSNYGIYVAAAAFTLVATSVAQMGAEVFLIRRPEAPSRSLYDEVFTCLVCSSVVTTLIALGATFAFGSLLRPVGVLLPLRILLLSVPFNVLWAPAQARIERSFGYRKMGLLEVVGDVALYGTAVPLAFLGAGAWSLIAGYFAWQIWLLVGSYVLSGLRPRLRWSSATARELAKYGFSYSASIWILRLGGIVSPLVVGGFFGAAGVGYVAFAQRLVDTIGFAQRGAYRLGLVALSRIPPEQKDRIRRALEEGSTLQLIALGLPFAAFGLVAHSVIPLLFGHQWNSAIGLYCLLALASLLGSAGLIQSTYLFSQGRNSTVARSVSIQTGVLAATSVPLVWHFGIDGFGYATLLALADLIYLDRKVRATVPTSYRHYLPVVLATAPLVMFPVAPFPFSLVLLAPTALYFGVPSTRHEGIRTYGVIRTALARRRDEAPS